MKPRTTLIALTAMIAGLVIARTATDAGTPDPFREEVYATIRWDGRDNTRVIRPNGRVDPMRGLFSEASRPKDTDERAFYMNVAMNALAREGFVFAGMTEETIVMRRAVK